MEMINMLAEGIISADDLDGFSPELIEHINRVTEFRNQDRRTIIMPGNSIIKIDGISQPIESII